MLRGYVQTLTFPYDVLNLKGFERKEGNFHHCVRGLGGLFLENPASCYLPRLEACKYLYL